MSDAPSTPEDFALSHPPGHTPAYPPGHAAADAPAPAKPTTAKPEWANPAVDAVVQLFNHLSPADLPRLGQFYAEGAVFKDPFNEVQGVSAIRGIFEHMYTALDAPRFQVLETVAEGSQCFITWHFLFRFKGAAAEQCVRGASHLKFNGAGLITLHRDYWDAAEELYEKLPVLGSFMRWLKKRAGGH